MYGFYCNWKKRKLAIKSLRISVEITKVSGSILRYLRYNVPLLYFFINEIKIVFFSFSLSAIV